MDDIFAATPELRWRLNPTPGDRPTLEQKWVRQSVEDWQEAEEEWRPVPYYEERF